MNPSDHGGTGSGAVHVTEEICVDLLGGLLTEEERTFVLAHLGACPTCEGRFQEIYADRERALTLGVVRRGEDGRLVLEEREIPEEEAPAAGRGPIDAIRERFGSFRLPRYRLAGALATAAVGVLIVFTALQLGPPDGLDPHRLPGRMDDLQYRSAVEHSRDVDLGAGLEAYADQDLDRAVELLQKADVDGVSAIIRNLYLANALAEQGDYRDACDLLKDLPLHRVPDPWGSEASWTLYVSLRRSGQEQSADSLLRLLIDHPGEVGERAREIE